MISLSQVVEFFFFTFMEHQALKSSLTSDTWPILPVDEDLQRRITFHIDGQQL